jgi:hypothetical protein
MYARVVENGLGHTVDAVRLLAMAAVATNQMDIVQSYVMLFRARGMRSVRIGHRRRRRLFILIACNRQEGIIVTFFNFIFDEVV